MKKFPFVLVCVLCVLNLGLGRADEVAATNKRPLQVFVHYMGCFPLGYGPMLSERYDNDYSNSKFRHDSTNNDTVKGGRFLTWPLAPESTHKTPLTPIQSADLEIRRAIREGIDGFDIDAWAGGDLCKGTLDHLFEAAEAGHYKFQITICIDAWCIAPGGPDGYYEAIKYLLDKHGNSPNLARRDGKPLIFTYQAQGLGTSGLDMSKESGWAGFVDRYKDVEKRIGQPLFFFWDFTQLFMGQESMTQGKPNLSLDAATYLASHGAGALGGFTDWTDAAGMEKLAAGVHAGTADWSPPIWYQYANMIWGGGPPSPVDIDKLQMTWTRARDQKATLLQFVTWNDYGEHTTLAPTEASGYGIGDLNSYYAKWWKTGQQPKPDHDRIYVVYRDHTSAKTFPWQGSGQLPSDIEVITDLPSPGLIRLPGRTDNGKPIEFMAPAGFSTKAFPLTPGPIDLELMREDEVVAHVHGRESVTDLPFRRDPILYCASTEDAKYWNEDFPGEPYPTQSYNGDDDHNGLPNWFEMYWLGKWNDFSTATGHDSKSDPFNTGQSLLQHYHDQTDPTKKAASYPAGWVWDLQALASKTPGFNPDKDEQGTLTWYYMAVDGVTNVPIKHDGKYHPMFYYNNGVWLDSGKCAAQVKWDTTAKPPVFLMSGTWSGHPTPCAPILAWESPIDGKVDIDLQMSKADPNGNGNVSLESADGKMLWNHNFTEPTDVQTVNVPGVKVAKGNRLYLINDDHSSTVKLSVYKITVK